MALSSRSPSLGVTQHPALWSSDFPRKPVRLSRSPDPLTFTQSILERFDGQRSVRQADLGPGEGRRAGRKQDLFDRARRAGRSRPMFEFYVGLPFNRLGGFQRNPGPLAGFDAEGPRGKPCRLAGACAPGAAPPGGSGRGSLERPLGGEDAGFRPSTLEAPLAGRHTSR